MKPPKKRGLALIHQNPTSKHCKKDHNTPRLGSLLWRKKKGLLTWSDETFFYLKIRSPRGNYTVPLPDDIADKAITDKACVDIRSFF